VTDRHYGRWVALLSKNAREEALPLAPELDKTVIVVRRATIYFVHLSKLFAITR
jgi:hypothetical protein